MTNDTTPEFENMITMWQNFHPQHVAAAADTALFLTYAESAITASGWMWPTFGNLLAAHGGFRSDKDAKDEAKRCQIVADLGSYPYTATAFVEAWLDSRGYGMDFAGSFLRNGRTTDHDQNYILNQMKLWCHEKKHLNTAAVECALDVWMQDRVNAIKASTFATLRFDPNTNQSELGRFVRLILAPKADEVETELTYRAAEVALANLIFRTKNHMRGTMKNSCHMMPVLQGKQGDGKSSAIKAFLAPLGAMVSGGDFDAFGDNDMSYQFSKMPVIVFEEMQGASKMDVKKLKNIMTEENKMMRQAYARSSNRRIISTFIGSSNKDISEMIKDETGNRRFIQFETQAFDRTKLDTINFVEIWKSVDEDAEDSPKYANKDDLDAIEMIQEGQRNRSPVEDWILNGDSYNIPWEKPTKALKLWASFEEFLTDASRGEARHWGYKRLGAAIRELGQAGRFDVKITRTSGSDSYAITRPDDVEAVALPTYRTDRIVDLNAHRKA